MNPQLLAAAYAMSTAVVFATFSVLVRKGSQHANALTGVFIGMFTSLPVMIAITWHLWEPAWWSPPAFFYFALAGLVGPAMSRVFLYLSISYLGVARAMPFNSMTPFFSTSLAVAFLGERPGALILAGTLFIVFGSVALTYKKADDTSWQRKHLWLACASTVTAAFSFLFRKFAFAHVSAPLMGATLSTLAGFVFLVTFIPLFPRDQKPNQFGRPKAWLIYGFCGLLNALGFFLHFTAISIGDLSVVAPLTSTAPVFSLVMSIFLLRKMERITPSIIAGTVCMVIGAALIGWRVRQ